MTADILPMPRKEPDPRRHLVDLFKSKFKDETGKDDPTTWPQEIRAMLHFRFVDEETGEVFEGYPTEDAWKDQLNGFFKNEWARENVGFSFFHFIKHFGKFAKYVPVKKSKPALVRQYDSCPKCGEEYPKGTVRQCKCK